MEGVTVTQDEGRTRYEFTHPDARPATPEPSKSDTPADGAPAKAADGQSPTTPPEGAAQQGDPDLPDEELEKIVRNPKVQARIDQLANNLTGNKLQRERERLRAELQKEIQEEQARWERLDEAYQFLVAEGREKFMDRFGVDEADAAKWEADYLRERRRGPDAASAPVDRSQIENEVTMALAQGAIEEFRRGVEALPFYGDLPDDSKKALAALKFDPATNWFADGLNALAAGLKARDDKIEREHKKALDEARQAGANNAHAEREESAPIVVGGSPSEFSNFKDVEIAYSTGQISRERFHEEKKRFRVDH